MALALPWAMSISSMLLLLLLFHLQTLQFHTVDAAIVEPNLQHHHQHQQQQQQQMKNSAEPKDPEIQEFSDVADQLSSAKGRPKLRVLIILIAFSYMKTHLALHRELARILESDKENVEYVHLLGFVECDLLEGMKSQELRTPRLVVEFAPHDSEFTQMPNFWERRIYFEPTKDYDDLYLGVVNSEELILRLDGLNFNVGIAETIKTAGLSLFQMLPSIRHTVATLSFLPMNELYEHLGFDQHKLHVPDVIWGQLGDHLVVGKSIAELRALAGEGGGGKASRARLTELKKRQADIERKNEQLMGKMIGNEERSWKYYCDPVKAYLHKHHPPLAASFRCPPLKELFQRISYFFTNSQPSLAFPVQEQWLLAADKTEMQQKLRFMGGIGLPKTDHEGQEEIFRTTKGILEGDEEIIKEIERASSTECPRLKGGGHGTILVSFGTAVKMSEMPAERRTAFREAFHEFPEFTFIWKSEDFEVGKGGKGRMPYRCDGNIFMNSWVLQPAILMHPKTRLFVSHCGNNSLIETEHSGLPAIYFPFFADQYYNAEAMAARGRAIVLDAREKDVQRMKQELVEAIKQMLKHSRIPMQLKTKNEAAHEFLHAIVALRAL